MLLMYPLSLILYMYCGIAHLSTDLHQGFGYLHLSRVLLLAVGRTCIVILHFFFGALRLLVGGQEGNVACEKLSVGLVAVMI